jgi:flagellar motility protein MotE (MotC chaperone)
MFKYLKIGFFIVLTAAIVGKGYDLYGHFSTTAHAQPPSGSPDAATASEGKNPESNTQKPPSAAPETSQSQKKPDEENETKPLTDFTSSEIQLLQSLRERREQLAVREAALEEREKLLNAMEGQIEAKIQELNSIKGHIEAIKKDIDEQSKRFESNQDEQTKMLVRVYEKMKPKDAAAIFNNLELTILLDVVKGMREAKLAPVLALMNPEKTKLLSSELARRETLPKLPE